MMLFLGGRMIENKEKVDSKLTEKTVRSVSKKVEPSTKNQ